MRRQFRNRNVAVDDENPYWMSFSDVMSGLLIIFILASIALLIQLMEAKQSFNDEVVEIRKAEVVRQNILEEARDELIRRGIKVELSENKTILRISNELLGFGTGKNTIQAQYQQTALEIGEVLYRLITKNDRIRYLDTVFIEGHTDSRRFYGNDCREKGNWCLSAMRAISLWQFWQTNLQEGMHLDSLANTDNQPLFSVSGYAATRPVVATESSEDDFSKNRRIDIRFTIRRPSSIELETVRARLEGEAP